MAGKPWDLGQVSEQFDTARSDYDATKRSRFIRQRRGLAPHGGTADYHFRTEPKYYELIENCRDLDRNDGIAGPTVTKACDNEIQGGFVLSPETGDPELDMYLWQLWQDFALDPDATDIAGEMNWHDYEMVVSRSVKVDGDCVVLGTNRGQLQFIEAHSVVTKNRHVDTFLGVTMDKLRRRQKYWISLDPIQPGRGKEQAVPVQVRDKEGNRQLFHPYIKERSSLTRGVSAFARIFATTGMVDDIRFAKLVQTQVVSCITFIRKKQAISGSQLPSVGKQGGHAGYGDSSTATTSSGQTRKVEGMSPGKEIELDPGEEMEGFSPQVPNAEFFPHVWLELSIIGANLGMPVCQMLLDFTKETFVGFRGATDEARKGYRRNQRNLIKRFHTPAYKWKVRHALQSGRHPFLAAKFKAYGDRIFNHVWRAPSWPYLEPVNDAAGALLEVRNGLTSRRRKSAERGDDWQEISDESIDDNAYAIIGAKKKAAEINKQYPDDPVSWRDLINLPTADGIQVSLNNQQAQASPKPNDQPGGKSA